MHENLLIWMGMIKCHDNKYKWLPYVDGLDFLLNMGALVDVEHELVEVYSGSGLNV